MNLSEDQEFFRETIEIIMKVKLQNVEKLDFIVYEKFNLYWRDL